MKEIFCTLFNYGYLIKGLSLYRSMERSIESFHLYILAMDETTNRTLNSLDLKHVTVLYYQDVMDDELKASLSGRIGPSFFWTFTPIIIEYVLTKMQERWCTYIDADCYFLGEPGRILDEIKEHDYSVGIVEHRYRKDESYDKWIGLNGRYNVAFNVFRNEENSLHILREWKEQCIECCTDTPTGESFGDQLYLNEWPDKYAGVCVINHIGIDVAPWNVSNYTVRRVNGSFMVSEDGKTYKELIMYHFHALGLISSHLVSLNLWNPKPRHESRDLYALYAGYVGDLKVSRGMIDGYAQSVTEEERGREGLKNGRISDLVQKIKDRKEKNILELLRNVIVV